MPEIRHCLGLRLHPPPGHRRPAFIGLSFQHRLRHLKGDSFILDIRSAIIGYQRREPRPTPPGYRRTSTGRGRRRPGRQSQTAAHPSRGSAIRPEAEKSARRALRCQPRAVWRERRDFESIQYFSVPLDRERRGATGARTKELRWTKTAWRMTPKYARRREASSGATGGRLFQRSTWSSSAPKVIVPTVTRQLATCT
jgi:hypothetical protein